MPITAGPQVPRTDAGDEEVYRRVFRKQVLGLLKMGYDRIKATNCEKAEEQNITGELVRVIREVIDDRSAPGWASRYAVHDDPPENVGGRRGKRRPRLDIRFERTQVGPHARYAFEAKRLCTGSHGVSGYLGAEGLGAFLDGSYSTGEAEAGMLGYVQSDDSDQWAAKLCDKVNGDASSLNLSEQWSAEQVIPELKHCYRTVHKRPSVGQPVTLYHILLMFCGSN